MSLIEKIEKSPDLIKHSAAVHIKAELSFVERKTMNILLKNSYIDIERKNIHCIKLSEMQELIGWKSQNLKEINNTLHRLVSTPIRWNILEKDKKKKWGSSALLAGFEIEEGTGVCKYSFSPTLIKKLSNPNIYVKISLYTQREFKGKYALILWEFITEHICTSKNGVDNLEVELSLEKLKDLLSIKDKDNIQFKILRRNIINPALKEINRVANITIKLEARRENRKIVAITLKSAKKTEKEIEKLEQESKLLIILKEEFAMSDSYINKNIMQYMKTSSGKERVANAIEASKEYINDNTNRGIKTTKQAVIKKAIENEWRARDLLSSLEKLDPIPEDKTKWHISKNQDHQKSFDKFLELLKDRVGEATYDSWFKLNLQSIESEEIVLETRNEFFKQELINKYESIITEISLKIFNKKFCKILPK